jgi:tryptophan halogenase
MPACHATYKNSIRFTNFRENKGESFHYPFIKGHDLVDKYKGLNTWGELTSEYPDDFPPEVFSELYAPSNTFLANYNKQTDNQNGILRLFNFKEDTAYHMNAALFGQYLKDHVALPNGVKHILNEIVSHEKDDDGNISKIVCKDGLELTADLWIDCTGFRSQLLEQWMGSEFISFDNILANDKAWACPIDYNDREKEMVNYTDCHALKNGWVWNTPLWTRIGKGYVFSTKFTTEEDAKEEFVEHIARVHGQQHADKARNEMRLVHIKHGKRAKGWIKNVVGIGLSYGFVEPLESTGLLTTHENIIKLLEVLNRRNGYVSRMEKESYNHVVDVTVDGFASFVSIHYAFSMRTDTPYWKWATQECDYQPEMFDKFQTKQNGYGHLGLTISDQNFNFGQQGIPFILGGLGVRNISTKGFAKIHNEFQHIDPSGLEFTRERFLEYKQFLKQYMTTLPSNYQFMKDRLYGGKDEYLTSQADDKA